VIFALSGQTGPVWFVLEGVEGADAVDAGCARAP
jgi:hypothetical protein